MGINLRPGTLSDENSGGVELGRTPNVNGNIGREKVARVADALLAAEGVKNSWIDLVEGSEDIQQAVQRVVRDGVNAIEGEPVTKE